MGEPSDWWDYKQIEKFYEERGRAFLKILQRHQKATEKGDDEARKKAVEAMRKHRIKDEIYKKKAAGIYFPWY